MFFAYMKRLTRMFGQMLTLTALAMCLSCSPRSTPVQEGAIVGKWQRVDKPGISMAFLKDGTFSADVAGQRLLGGKYRLIEGDRITLDFDTSSPKTGPVTNKVYMAGEELRITPADGRTERYKRIE
jgi:hypothetical protein